jgi:hypothetical protein
MQISLPTFAMYVLMNMFLFASRRADIVTVDTIPNA